MKYTYGFLGTGNMGSALAEAVVKKVPSDRIIVTNRTAVKAKTLSRKLKTFTGTNDEAARESSALVLGVKPQMLESVLTPLQGALAENGRPVLVTMAAGVPMSRICELAGGEYPVIRIMPNTPVAAGAGVILAAHNDLVSGDEFEQFLSDFSEAGLLVPMNEEQIDAASVISGCGPAFYYMFMDAMAKAGEQLGLSYETAATLAEATARGSAILAEGSSASLEDLRIAVCSPGGSTIEGVRSFQKDDLDECVRRALKAAYDRTLELANS